VLLSGKDGEGWPVMACARPPLVPVRFPRFDTHLAVTLTYRVANDGGLPVDGSLQALRRIEDRLTDALAGTGTLLAHETGHGVRTLHYYVDPTTDAAERIRTRLPEWREGPADLAQSYDPGLRHVRHLSP
jgi:hypothetical protein